MMVRASVVVPTFKRPELLDRCLAALVTQKFDPSAYEVIIADDAACAETKRLLEFWSKRVDAPLLRYIPVTQTHGPAAARNCGWRAAWGEVIAFTDDDCIPTPDWLGAGMEAFRQGVIGVWGRIIVPLPRTPTDYERNAAELEKAEFVTANCFYRRDVLAEVGGFDERFTRPWREDSDLFFTVWEHYGGRSEGGAGRGFTSLCSHEKPGPERTTPPLLVYAPEAVVLHPVRPAPWGVSLGQQRKSMFNALLYKKHPTLYRRRIQSAPPWSYYCILGALLVLFVGIGTGQEGLALMAAGTWGFMTGRFCGRRLRRTSHTPRHVAEMIVTSAIIPLLSIFWRICGALRFRVFFL